TPSGQPELHITWTDGVDLQFAEDDPHGDDENGSGRLRSALFRGDVKVISSEFLMDAEQMNVQLPPDGDAESIESIHATGNVKVDGVIERASIRCADLHLELGQTAMGSTIPKIMTATGDVAALDEEQAIWADWLQVSFRE